jgi:hypothetical protein
LHRAVYARIGYFLRVLARFRVAVGRVLAVLVNFNGVLSLHGHQGTSIGSIFNSINAHVTHSDYFKGRHRCAQAKVVQTAFDRKIRQKARQVPHWCS